MAEGATRTRILTRTGLFLGSSLAYYNGGIDAIVLQLKERGGAGRGGGGGGGGGPGQVSICAQDASALLKRKQSRTGRAVYEQAKADKRIIK